MYCTVTGLVDANVDKAIMGFKVANILNVKTGEYIELTLDLGRLILQGIRCNEEAYAFKISYRLNNILNVKGRLLKVRRWRSTRKRLDRVALKLLRPSTIAVSRLVDVKRLLVGKTVSLNSILPVEVYGGEVYLLKIVDLNPNVKAGIITSDTFMEISK